jgi:outer membrane lipoprotein-sorting protein
MLKKALVLALLLVPTIAGAETPEEKGLAIAIDADRLDSGFGAYVVDAKLILTSRARDKSDRFFEMHTLEVNGDGDKRLVVFSQPRDIKGTVTLTYSHGLEADDQWVYLPGLSRTKRLAARDKTGPFMGSEFSFEDIGTWEVKKYTYRYLRDEVLDGRDCFVIENTPAYEFSGYTRQIEWVDKEIHQPRRLQFFDRNNLPLKTLVFENYKQYGGRWWRPDRMVMENHQTGNRSTIEWTDYRFGVELSVKNFTPDALARFSR